MTEDSIDSIDYVTVIPSVLDSRARAYIAQEVLKVFLYMNGQTPGPVDTFITENIREHDRKASLRTKQLEKQATIIKSHIDALDSSFFLDGEIQGIRIILGPSSLRPWRAIEMDFGPLDDLMSKREAYDIKKIKSVSRRVVQDLISNGSPFTLNQQKPCKSTTLSLFALVPSSDANACPSSSVPQDANHYQDKSTSPKRAADMLPWNIYRPKISRDECRGVENSSFGEGSSFFAHFVPRWNHELSLKNKRAAPNRYVFHAMSPERIDLADDRELRSHDGRPVIWTEYIPKKR